MAFVAPSCLPGRAFRRQSRQLHPNASVYATLLAGRSTPTMVQSSPGPPKVSPVPTATPTSDGPVEVLELTLENVEMVRACGYLASLRPCRLRGALL
jgi:hypothetical protein